MSEHYKRRLQNHILEILADLLAREVRDPRADGVVVTAVSLNEDYSVAKVYIMGGEEDALRGLRKASGFLRGEVGRYLKMRNSPELRFLEDESLERYNRIEEVLSEHAPGEAALAESEEDLDSV